MMKNLIYIILEGYKMTANTKPIKKDILTDGAKIRLFLHQYIYPTFLPDMFVRGFNAGTLDPNSRTIKVSFNDLNGKTIDELMENLFHSHIDEIMGQIHNHPELKWSGEESMYFSDPLYRRMLYDTLCMNNFFFIKL